MNTGEKIKHARKKAGFTQKELGIKLGISQAAVGQFEKETSNPTLETLTKIAGALGIDVRELYGNDSITESKQLSSFLNYLDTLGYEFIDGSFYDAPSSEIGLLHIKNENLDIPLTSIDFDMLENSIKDDISLEIYRLRKEKGI